jgi:hypothetical protein
MMRVLTLMVVLIATACLMQGAISTELVLSDGTNSVTIDQNGVATTVGTATVTTASGSGPGGTIVFVGSVGAFSVNITTGRGGAVEVRPALINVNSIDVQSVGAGDLTIQFSDTNFTDLAPTLNLSASVTFTAANIPHGSTATFTGLGSAANTIPAATMIGALGPFTDNSSPGAQSGSDTKDFANPIGATGSLTETIALHFTGASEIDTGFTIANVVVPEPASVVLLGTTLLGVTALLRKKSKRA